MKNIHINNSYKIWKLSDMRSILHKECLNQLGSYYPELALNRSTTTMYVEWWLHNIGYYVTKPFCFLKDIKKINLRCKDVDLEKRV